MNELQIFNNEEFGQIRTIEVDGKPYFVANDVAKALGYSNPSKATNDHCKHAVYGRGNDSLGRENNFKYIPESDIYRLVIGSQLPTAERFESWVFDEVIPSIRKNDGYIKNQENLTPEQIVANALIVAQNIIAERDKQIEEMQPKADYFDALVDRNLLTNFRDTAKELGVKERAFITFLIDNKYVYRDSKNILKPHANKNNGLFEVKEYNSRYSEHAGLQTLITPKGRETFRLLLERSFDNE